MKKILIIIVIVLTFVGCNNIDIAEETETSVETNTLTPTEIITPSPSLTEELTPTPTTTPEPVLEGFDESYDNGDRANVNVAAEGNNIYYIYSQKQPNSDMGLLYHYNINNNKETIVNKIIQNNYYISMWGYAGKYNGNIRIIDDYIYYNSQYGLRRMNINTGEKEDIITNEDMQEIAKKRVNSERISKQPGIINFIINNNKIIFRFMSEYENEQVTVDSRIDLNGEGIEEFDDYVKGVYNYYIIKNDVIYNSDTICTINNNEEAEVFNVIAETWIDKCVITGNRIYMVDFDRSNPQNTSSIQGFDINTHEEIYYEKYDYPRIYIESANQYIFKFFFDEDWNPQTMTLMDTKNDVEYSEDELRELIVGDFELEQFYTAYWCMHEGAMYLCSPGETEDTAYCKIYKMTIEDGKMVFEHLYTHEEELE